MAPADSPRTSAVLHLEIYTIPLNLTWKMFNTQRINIHNIYSYCNESLNVVYYNISLKTNNKIYSVIFLVYRPDPPRFCSATPVGQSDLQITRDASGNRERPFDGHFNNGRVRRRRSAAKDYLPDDLHHRRRVAGAEKVTCDSWNKWHARQTVPTMYIEHNTAIYVAIFRTVC